MYSSRLISAAFTASLLAVTSALSAEAITAFNVVWQEDFSGTGSINLTNWQYYPGATSNGEVETYLAGGDNCQLTGQGTLLITPEFQNGQWTSCRIETLPTFQAPAGGQMVVQARLKLGSPGASLQGIWPAFWSLGDSMRHGTPWPDCGEIDTMEEINGTSLGYGTVHCSSCGEPDGLSSNIEFDYGTYHTWAHAIDLRESDWSAQSITWYMDGQPYHVVHGSDVGDADAWTAVAQSPMYMTLDVAVGGSWPGAPTSQTVSGAAAGMEVLYVAVYHSS